MTTRRFLHFSAFLLIPALSSVTPLIAIPAITASAGSAGWEAYALGLSVGSAVGTLVELGWPLTGPQRVAAEASGVRWVTLISSLRTRVLALLVLAPVGAGAATVLALRTTPDHLGTVVLMALATAVAGLSGNWYFIGVGQPLRILSSDAIPRAMLVSAASVAVLNGAPLIAVPACYLLAGLVSPGASLLLARHERRQPARLRFDDDLRAIRSQLSAVGSRSVGALYTALPITLVGLVAPSALAAFAAAERLMRMTLTMLQAVPNVLQNWLGSARTARQRRSRVLNSIALNAVVGLVCGLAFALLVPWVSTVLFTGTVEVDDGLAALAGGVLMLVCISRATGPLALVRLGQINAITGSAVAAALVGVPAICFLAAAAGAGGAMLGEIVAEVAAITVQATVLVVVLRRDRDEVASSDAGRAT